MTPAGALECARHLAGLEARRADVHALRCAIYHGAHALNVGVPTTLGAAVGVGNRVPERRALSAYVAGGSHDYSPDPVVAPGQAHKNLGSGEEQPHKSSRQ